MKRNIDSNPNKGSNVQIAPYFIGAVNDHERRTLDAIAGAMLGPCLVKVDVEGGEMDVLRGAQAMLARPDVRWLIETHSRELEDGCIEILSSSGYEFRVVKNSWWRVLIPENRAIPHNRWLVARRK
jgi:hypothetical protein